MSLRSVLIAAFALFAPAADSFSAQESAPPEPLVVATKDAPPFSFKGPSGAWEGLSIDLWRGIAADLDVAFEFEEASLDDLVSGLGGRTLRRVGRRAHDHPGARRGPRLHAHVLPLRARDHRQR